MLSPISGYLRVLARSRAVGVHSTASFSWLGALFSAAAFAACLPTAALNERDMVSDETQGAHHPAGNAVDDAQQAPKQTQHAQRPYAVYNQRGKQLRAREAPPNPLPSLESQREMA